MYSKANQYQGYKGASDSSRFSANLQQKQTLKFQPKNQATQKVADKSDSQKNPKAAETGVNLDKANENVAKNSQVRGNEKQGCPNCGGGCANCGCANCA